MAIVKFQFSNSIDAYWEFLSKSDILDYLQELYDYNNPLSIDVSDLSARELVDNAVRHLGIDLIELAEDFCRDRDDISGPLLHSISVSGRTCGSLDNATKTETREIRHEQMDNEVAVYWIDVGAFTYSGEIEVEEELDLAKVEFVLHPVFEHVPVVLEILYAGEPIELEQSEVGSYQLNAGFKF